VTKEGLMAVTLGTSCIDKMKSSLIMFNYLLFYSLKVTPEDMLPVTMCTSCIYKLEMCHQFVHGCLDADMKLRAILGLEMEDLVSKPSKINVFIMYLSGCLSLSVDAVRSSCCIVLNGSMISDC
jgi:hypothetical protein